MVGRDDLQGRIVGDHLADAWRGAKVALVHDGQVYGQGVADQVSRRLNERNLQPALLETVAPGATDFNDLIGRLEAAAIDVLFFGGYMAEGDLLIRQLHERMPDLAILVPDGVQGDDFPLITGEAVKGVLMTSAPDAATKPDAAEVMEAFRAEGFEPSGFRRHAPGPRYHRGVGRGGRAGRYDRGKGGGGGATRPCSGPSASTTRATSPATTASSGTSGRPTDRSRSSRRRLPIVRGGEACEW